jgi:hypothetical protein
MNQKYHSSDATDGWEHSFKQRHAEIVNLPNSRLADSAVPSAVNEWQ